MLPTRSPSGKFDLSVSRPHVGLRPEKPGELVAVSGIGSEPCLVTAVKLVGAIGAGAVDLGRRGTDPRTAVDGPHAHVAPAHRCTVSAPVRRSSVIIACKCSTRRRRCRDDAYDRDYLVLAKPIVIMKSILPGTAKMPHASFQRISAGSSNIGGSGALLARSVVLGLRGELAKPGRFTVADCTGAATAPPAGDAAAVDHLGPGNQNGPSPHDRPSLGAPVYFCDSRSPWQRGSNENTNGLLRDYFPKGTDLSTHSTQHLLAVENEFNNRPRLVLNDRAPAELFWALLASENRPRCDVD
jgi:hypothetical protein